MGVILTEQGPLWVSNVGSLCFSGCQWGSVGAPLGSTGLSWGQWATVEINECQMGIIQALF